jgi:hypothetical protein
MNCINLDVYGHKHPFGAVQHALCEVWLQTESLSLHDLFSTGRRLLDV